MSKQNWLDDVRREANTLAKLQTDVKHLRFLLHTVADELEIIYGPDFKPGELEQLRARIRRLDETNTRLTKYLEKARYWPSVRSVGFGTWFERWQKDMSGFLAMEEKRKEKESKQ